MGYSSSDTPFNALGKTGGEQSHTLLTTEIPSHLHSVDPPATASGNNSANHTHTVDPASFNATIGISQWTSNPGSWVAGGNMAVYSGSTNIAINVPSTTSGNNSASHTHTTDIAAFNSANTGGDAAHNVLDPYVTMNYIIKY